MTQSSDRLDRIEALLAATAEAQAVTQANLEATRQITDSNARAIEAWSECITEGDQRGQTALETSIADTVAMIADLGRQQQETDQRFEVWLQDSRADRQRAEQRDREWQERFDQSMQANSTEHRAFTQNIQVLLAEIARLWQRVAG